MTLGQRIVQYRKALGLSQADLADAVGVSRQAVSKWELDEAQPDAAKIVLLAQALHVSTDQLLLGQKESSQEGVSTGDGESAAVAQSLLPRDHSSARTDYLGLLRRLIQKHGYKAGYFFIAYGVVALLIAGVMFLMVHGFFSAANSTFPSPGSGLFGRRFFDDNFYGVQIEFAPDVELTPEEQQVISDYSQHHPETDYRGGGWYS